MRFGSARQVIGMLLLSVGIFLLTACGGGGGGGGSASDGPIVPPSPTVKTGTFVDGPVDGLKYVSGSTTGTTQNGGQFQYEVGQSVKFYVADIVFGEVPSSTVEQKGIVSPVNMAPAGSDHTTPEVVARVQLLMTIAPPDGNGRMQIPTAIQTKTTAIQDKQINFNTANLLTLAQQLDAAVPAVKTQQEAIDHLNNSLAGIVTVSGAVTRQDLNNQPLAGVGITFAKLDNSGKATGVSYTTTSDSSGRYSISLPESGYYKLAPSLSGYVFGTQTSDFVFLIDKAKTIDIISAVQGSGGSITFN